MNNQRRIGCLQGKRCPSWMMCMGLGVCCCNPGSFDAKSQIISLLASTGGAFYLPSDSGNPTRISGDYTYLTALNDLLGNWDPATQTTDTAQAELTTSGGLFSGAQWYDASGIEIDGPTTIATVTGVPVSGNNEQHIVDIENGRCLIGYNISEGEFYTYTTFVTLTGTSVVQIADFSESIGGRISIGSRYDTTQAVFWSSYITAIIIAPQLSAAQKTILNTQLQRLV